MLNNKYVDAWYYRGNIKKDLHLFSEAISDYQHTIQLKNDFWQAYNNKGLCELNNRDYATSIKDLNKTIELNPGLASAYYLRGMAITESGKDGCPDFTIACNKGFAQAKAAISMYCKWFLYHK